ncbi:MAG TPA: Rid family hydrolase [Nevskiaceae bacterium]
MRSPRTVVTFCVTTLAALLLAGCASLNAPLHPQYIVPDDARLSASLYGYSQAVRVGPWITVSGQVGYDPATGAYGKTLEEQASLAFANLARVLRAAGASLSDVTSITTYQTDMRDLNAVVYARNAAFGDHRPTWTMVGVPALALPQLEFEVSATAYAPEKRRSAGGSTTDPGQ